MLVHLTTNGAPRRAKCLNMLRCLAAPGLGDAYPDLDVLECDWCRAER